MFTPTYRNTNNDPAVAKHNHEAFKSKSKQLAALTVFTLSIGITALYFSMKCDKPNFQFWNIIDPNNDNKHLGYLRSDQPITDTSFISSLSKAFQATTGYILSKNTDATPPNLYESSYIGSLSPSAACPLNNLRSNLPNNLAGKLRNAFDATANYWSNYYALILAVGIMFTAGGFSASCATAHTISQARFWNSETKRLDPHNQPLLLDAEPIGHPNPVAQATRQPNADTGVQMTYQPPGTEGFFFPAPGQQSAGEVALSMPSPTDHERLLAAEDSDSPVGSPAI
ncbi:MAG: hypothetical protein P1U63_04465 [Coxiellaceae bacterium]|nr:hypothetical protein [Coxiellaceae bacterium]